MPLTCKICGKKAILKRPKTVSRLYIVTLFRVKQKVCSKLQSITAGSSPLGLNTEYRATFERLAVSSGSSARQSIPRYMI